MRKVKNLKNKSKFGTIRFSMVVFSFAIICLMTLLSFYTLSLLNRYRYQIDTMFEKHIYLSDLATRMEAIDENLLGFLSSKSSSRLNEYLIQIEGLRNHEGHQLLMNQKDSLDYDLEMLMQKNIAHLTTRYMEEADAAIVAKRQRNVQGYFKHYEESKKIQGYIFSYIDQLNARQLSINSKTYLDLVEQIKLLQWISFIIIVDLILLSLLIVYMMSAKMVRPFTYLTHSAEALAEGQFDIDDIVIETKNEFSILAEAFNRMKRRIRQYIDEMKTQAAMEAALKDEQMKNIRMEHLLDNAKLNALQSQINPHFLFNTMNAGVQMAIMERATKTSQFFESMARLFRYNLRKMNETCTLLDEVNNIRDYYSLLTVRFGDRIHFEFAIEPETHDLRVPPLILQPLVENAFIHGLSGLEEGGTLYLKAYKADQHIIVTIKDTGKGMSQATIDKLMGPDEQQAGGIGVRNVRERLELFFHAEEVMLIQSCLGEGVKITLKLPRE